MSFWLLGLKKPAQSLSKWYVTRVNRVVDVAGACAAGLLALPILLPTLVCLIAHGGGVLFKQTRIGYRGRHFTIYKFKTMLNQVPAEIFLDVQEAALNGRLYKNSHDPRVTKLGRILRKTSIDELPQLWNVIIGDMSLIGPRPLVPHMVDLHNDLHRQRLSVKPGLTGLWQIRNRHQNRSIDEMLSDDLEYIRQWRSLNGHLIILFRTIHAIASARGAV